MNKVVEYKDGNVWYWSDPHNAGLSAFIANSIYGTMKLMKSDMNILACLSTVDDGVRNK